MPLLDTDILVRPLAERDWDTIVALEAGAYAADGLSEGRAALKSRHAPGTCFVLEHEGRVGGYLLALPYPPFRCPDLSRAEELGFDSRNLHAHDCVIAEELRGRGLGPALLHPSAATPRGSWGTSGSPSRWRTPLGGERFTGRRDPPRGLPAPTPRPCR